MFSSYSQYLDNAVNEIAKLPGIGKRTALRLALHLLKEDEVNVQSFVDAIANLKSKICYCKICHNISDTDICTICQQPKRDTTTICVVQDIRDIIAIENTAQFTGLYHVLGGIISPVDGIGPNQLTLESLFKRVKEEHINEVILALPATVEGDTTNFYIHKNIKEQVKTITTIARGIGIGEELEFTDEVTLGRSLLSRTDFDTSYSRRM
ncbi:MAG: recombination mediator RecR [Bacteroidales bacterium]|jgi:recombination protein RecR|nr:recombination mediator RecR [Bacteroidales bacterium]